MTEYKEACCSSPAAMCYWFAASLIAWGVLSLIGSYWRPLRGSSAATILFAMAIGCVCQLAQESHSSLRNYWATILDHCFGVPAVRRDYDSRQQFFGLAIPSHRGWHRISTGMAVREAFCA
jgi:hypothetical protein